MRRQQPTSTPNTHELPSRSRSKKQAPMLTQVRSVAPFTGAHEAVSASGPRAPYTLEEGVMPKGMEFMRGPGAKLPFSTHINTPAPQQLPQQAQVPALGGSDLSTALPLSSRPIARLSYDKHLEWLVNDRTCLGMKEGGPVAGMIACSAAMHSMVTPRRPVLSPRRPLPSHMPPQLGPLLPPSYREISREEQAAYAIESARDRLHSKGVLSLAAWSTAASESGL